MSLPGSGEGTLKISCLKVLQCIQLETEGLEGQNSQCLKTQILSNYTWKYSQVCMVLNNTVYAENENIIRLKNRNKDSGEAEWAMNLGKKSSTEDATVWRLKVPMYK